MPYRPTQAMRDAAQTALNYNDEVAPSKTSKKDCK